MNLPSLLLGLPFAALVLAFLLGGWLNHVRPLSAEGRRLADAAERAGLGQSAFALRVAAGAIAATSALAGLLGYRLGAPVLWFVLVPWVVALVTLSCGLGVTRLITRAACRQLTSSGRDQRAVLLSRTSLAATLLLEGTAGLVVLGTFVVTERSLGAKTALGLAFTAAATLSALALVFGRVGAALEHATTKLRPSSSEDSRPHPGTLSEVVAATFGRALSSSSALLTISGLSHALLIAHTIQLHSETSSSVALYPHLLRGLGLCALVFGALVVRSSEREPGSWASARGVAVTFVLFVAGAWSLAQSLEDPLLSRLLPGLASFLFSGIAVTLWLTSYLPPASLKQPLGPLRLGLGAAFALLGVGFFVALELSRGESALPAALGHALVAGCWATLVPFFYSHRLSGDIQRAARLGSRLTPELHFDPQDDLAPAAALTGSYWLVGLLLGFELVHLSGVAPSQLSLLAFGAVLGVSALLFALGRSSLGSARAREESLELVRAHEGDASAPSFGAVLDQGKNAVRRGYWGPLALVFGAPLLLLGFAALAPWFPVSSTIYGFSWGVLLVSGLLSWLVEGREPTSLAGHAGYALPLGLHLVTFLAAGAQLL